MWGLIAIGVVCVVGYVLYQEIIEEENMALAVFAGLVIAALIIAVTIMLFV